MKISWTQGVDKERAIDIKQNFKESTVLRKRFFELMVELIDSNRKSQVSKVLYDNPSWPYLQADKAGYERALRDMIDLFSE